MKKLNLVRASFFLSLLFVLSGCKANFDTGKELEAKSKISEISLAILAYQQEYGSAFQLFGKMERGTLPVKEIVEILGARGDDATLKNANPKRMAFLESGQNYSIDPWGSLYFISWNNCGLVGQLDFIVWSPGPNQINQFGQMDDIFLLNVKGHKQSK